MKNKLISILAFATLMMACSQEEPSAINNVSNDVDHYVSVEEALKKADRQFKELYGTETRSSSAALSSVIRFNPSKNTRSSETPKYYIFNYGNNEGFAIVGADNRLDDIYAISDEGSIELSDTLENKGLSWYLNSVLGSASLAGLPPIETPDSIKIPAYPSTIASRPFLGTLLSHLHQGNPYNKYCFTESGKQSVVGCTALAAGIVMAYHRWPDSLNGQTFVYNFNKAN